MSNSARGVGPNKIAAQDGLKLIDRYLKSGVMIGEILEPTEEGVPQGGPLSPLLAEPAAG